MPTLGEKISALRAARALTSQALADEAGVGRTTLVRIEKGGKPYGDTLRAILGALHRAAPLSEGDIFELGQSGWLSEGAILAYLSRLDPSPAKPTPTHADASDPARARCHAALDRMLAVAASPHEVELALVAMIAAFESQRPDPVTRQAGRHSA